jgi:hypothetical protein
MYGILKQKENPMRKTFDLNIVKPGEAQHDDSQIREAVAPTSPAARGPRDTQATGRAPADFNIAEPPVGRPGTETNVAKQPLPDIGNVSHDFATLDGIKNWRQQ